MMMMSLGLLLVLLGWVALPFVPAVHEAFRRRDAAALPIADRYVEDLGAPVDPSTMPEEGADVGLRSGAVTVGRIVRKSFIGPAGLEADEVVVQSLARLGEGTTVRRRVAVGEACEVDPGCVLRGSAEAGELMWLATDVRFERVHAPTIAVGVPPSGPGPVRPAPVAFALDADVVAGRALVRGDLRLPPGAHLRVDLVVTGRLVLGAGARVRGDVKAHDGVDLGEGACVVGNVVSGADLRLGRFARVTGAAVAGDTLRLEAGACVGRATVPATATGREVELASGAQVHGTLWAERLGRTLAETAAEAVAA